MWHCSEHQSCAEVDVERTAGVLESSKAWLTEGQNTGVLVALTEGLLEASCSGEPKASQSRLEIHEISLMKDFCLDTISPSILFAGFHFV
ncbi:hypothetical protein Tco_0493400 [Tanacetum coccineum]